MQALEVSNFGCVTGGSQSFESGANQFAHTAAEDGLLAEKIAFGLFFESGFDHAGFQTSEPERIGQSILESLTGGILRDCNKRGNAHPFDKQFADAMPRSFGSDHGHVDIRGGLDLVEVDVESMGEHEG